MNIAKNTEAIFLIALALAGATSLASAAVPAHRSDRDAVAATAAGGAGIPTVIVTAKRLSAEQ